MGVAPSLLPLTPFIARLAPAFDLDGENVADALWLAQWIASASPAPDRQDDASAPEPGRRPEPQRAPIALSHPPVDPTFPPVDLKSVDATAPRANQPYPVVLESHQAQQGDERLRVRAVRIPAGSAFPDGLEIVRGLRPLPRWILSRTDHVLDEDATVDETARCAGQLMPVMRPQMERWFEAALVAEYSESAEIWHDTLTELERLLRCSGLFRDVRRYTLSLSPHPRLITPAGAERPVAALRDSTARRAIFMFGSCTSEQWSDGSLAAVLAAWGETTPVVLVHALPERMWKQTVLGDPDILVEHLIPGIPNTRLRTTRAWWQPPRHDFSRQPTFPLPVFGLNRPSAEQWAKAVASRRATVAPGFLMRTSHTVRNAAARARSRRPVNAAARVRLFRSNASDGAVRLALRLAFGPFTVRWMQVLQAAVLGPDARHEQLAEILLSGLVQRLTPMGFGAPAEQVQFRFEPDVGKMLTELLEEDEARTTADLLRRFIYAEFGRTTDTRMWLGDETGTRLVVPASAQPLITLYKNLLDRLDLNALPEPELEPEAASQAPGSLLATFAPTSQPERALRGLDILWCEQGAESIAGEQATLQAYGASIAVATTPGNAADAFTGAAPDILVAPLEFTIGSAASGWNRFLQLAAAGLPVVLYSAPGLTDTPIEPSKDSRLRSTTRERLVETIAETSAAWRAEQLASRVVDRLVDIGVPRTTAMLLLQQPAAGLVRATSELESPESLHHLVVGLVAAITDCVSVLLYEQEHADSMELRAGVIKEGHDPPEEVPLTGIIGRAASLRVTQWVPDVRQETSYIAVDPTTRSELAIPLQARPRRVSVLNCESRQLDAFNDEQIRWLQALVTGYYPATLSSPEHAEARTHADRARRAFGAGRYNEAIDECNRSLAIVGDLRVLSCRASAYWYMHRYDKAIEDLDQVIAARGRLADWWLLSSRGQILVELARYDEALPDLDAAIDAVGGDLERAAFSYRARGVAHGALKRFDQAEADFAASRKGSPDNAWLDYSLAQYKKSRGASDEEVLEHYAAAIVRQGPPLNAPKLQDALTAIKSLAKLDFKLPDLKILLVRDERGLLETATVASERGHSNLAVVARAALCAFEPTAERHAELAAAYRIIGLDERARYHLTVVQSIAPGFFEELRPKGAEQAKDTSVSWLTAARKRLAKFLLGGS
jgi:tetratricopeptide (TPR) repeat protein